MGKKRKVDAIKSAAASPAPVPAASSTTPTAPLAEVACPTADAEIENALPEETETLETGHLETISPEIENQDVDPAGPDADADADAEAEEGHNEDEEIATQEIEGGAEEENLEEEDDDPVENLLESLSKEQLVELLRDVAVTNPSVLAVVRRTADADPAQRKIFVHGLGWDTTSETLTSVYGQYGEIEDLRVVADRATGRCKGYGFILFRHRSAARRALKEPQKKIGSRMTACQLASVGPVPPGGANPIFQKPTASIPAPAPATTPPVSELSNPYMTEKTLRKIHITNVGAEVDPQKLRLFFEKFGEIEEGPLGLDTGTGKFRGFALFAYKTIDGARKALEQTYRNFEGRILKCQQAIDGPKPNKGGYGGKKGSASGFGVGSHSVPGAPGVGHLMAPSGPSSAPFNLTGQQPTMAAAAGLNPTLGNAITALLAQGGVAAGLGLNNLMGPFGSNGVGNQGGPSGVSGGHGIQGGYGNASGFVGGYGGPGAAQGGYGLPPSGGSRNYMGQ